MASATYVFSLLSSLPSAGSSRFSHSSPMAIITEYDEDRIEPPGSPSKSKPKPKPKPKSRPKPEPQAEPAKPESQHQPSSTPQKNQASNPFTFWFYFTITVSLITLLFVSLSSFSPQDPKTWFLSLPSTLRTHYSNGRPIKVQIGPNEPAIEVFTYSKGSTKSSENVLIVHGLGCSSFTFRKVVDDLASKGVFAVAVDLPGSGFSDKTVVKEREKVGGGVLGRFWEVYDEIKEKGIFWGFDHLVEHGYVPFDEVGKNRASTRKVAEPLEMGSQELGRVLGQVVDSIRLAPVHLVLHDSALVMGANWVVENAGSLRSLTLIDTLPTGTALPLWAFEPPLIREVVLGVDYVFKRLIGSCCSKTIVGSSVEAHRILLKGRDGRQAIVGTGRKLNQSFDLSEWASTDGLKDVPIQVMWSSNWSEEWSEQGKRVAEVVSRAKLIKHSGGRWPQDDTSSEVAEIIASFVSSLPKTERKADEEPLPEHIQEMFDEAKSGDNLHDHGHGSHGHRHGHGHSHGAHAGYMDAYGLGEGHGWGM